MVERSNGKLKILMEGAPTWVISKNRAIEKKEKNVIEAAGSRNDLYHATAVYNEQHNRGIGLALADVR